jgi:SPP1 gp7 family putative phage head morphogenesis protein
VAATERTIRLLYGMRIEMNQSVDLATEALVRAWGRAWQELIPEWTAALDDLVDTPDGQWPSAAKIARARRARLALGYTANALDELAVATRSRILSSIPAVTGRAAYWVSELIDSQYPPHSATFGASFDRIAPAAIDAIVRRTTTRVVSQTRHLSTPAAAQMRNILIRGVAVGDNPLLAASTMLNRLDGAFHGGLNAARVIARTEMLDAHRDGARAQARANADILKGWQWTASLDKRTCRACWSMHGQVFPLDTPGPQDHQQGRCVGLPITRSWADLGFGEIHEPPSIIPNAEQVFANLPRAEQQQIMGAKVLDLYDRGDINWSDLATKRTTDGWRDSYIPTPLATLAS